MKQPMVSCPTGVNEEQFRPIHGFSDQQQTVYNEVKQQYLNALNEITMLDSTILPQVNIQDLTTPEQATFIQELNQVANLHPGQEEDSQVQHAIKSNIIQARDNKQSPCARKDDDSSFGSLPDTISFQDEQDPDHDGDGSHYSASTRMKGRKHKVKLRAKFGDKILWDGKRSTF